MQPLISLLDASSWAFAALWTGAVSVCTAGWRASFRASDVDGEHSTKREAAMWIGALSGAAPLLTFFGFVVALIVAGTGDFSAIGKSGGLSLDILWVVGSPLVVLANMLSTWLSLVGLAAAVPSRPLTTMAVGTLAVASMAQSASLALSVSA